MSRRALTTAGLVLTALLVMSCAKNVGRARAETYAVELQAGKKCLVRWVFAIGHKDEAGITAEHQTWVAWVSRVRSRLKDDYGEAIATHFALGIPRTAILGSSEPWELEAQLATLDALILQMRAGSLTPVGA
jgi:hypothetical protein